MIENGEIAIGFKSGEEKLFIKNTDNEIVEFEPTKRIIPNFYKSEIFDLIYPVGSVYINVNDIDPSILFGIGEWEKIKDTFLLSAGDKYTAGDVGGEEKTTLSHTQLPNVAGQFTMHHAAISTNVSAVDGCFTTDTINANTYKNGGTELTGARSIGRVIFNNGGEGKAHNNMPPYLVVNMWKRIS